MAMLIALCLFSAALGRFCFLLRPFDTDAALFIYMGQMVANGGRLGHDLIDNKFPTVGLMTSIIWKTFGTCWPAYIALQAALSLATAWILARTAARVVGPHAWLPTMLFAIVFLNFTTAVFGGFQLETIQIFFIALAASAGVDIILNDNPADAFVAGLCAGCGAMFKPTAAGILIAISIGLLLRRKKPALSFLAMAAGVCIPLLFAFIYLVNADLLRDMPALYRQISTYAQQSVFDAGELIKPVAALALLGFPMLIRGFVYRRQREPGGQTPASAVVVFLVAWLIIEITGVILQRRMYAYHFLPMIPPAALLFGILPRCSRPGALAGGLVPIALLSIVQACNLIAATGPHEDRLPLSDYLAAHTRPGDAVWMDAWPRLVLETGLRPATRLPFTFLFTNYDEAGLDYSAGMIADFQRTKPAYIILPMPLDRRMQYQIDFYPELNRLAIRRENYIAGWHRIEQYTLANYVKETVIGNNAVYHRRTP